MTTEELIKFWDKSNFVEGTKIHKEDYEFVKDNLVTNCKDFNSYISYYFDNPEDSNFHSNLWPSPYCGDIRKAKIFVLGLNPGFDCDYFYEENPEIAKVLEKTLAQDLDSEEYPFFVLNPKYSWIGGSKYWLQKLNGIVEEAKKSTGKTTSQVLKKISENVAALELVPYHSKTFKYSKYEKLPSVKMMLNFINEVVIPGVESGKYTLIILRKWSDLQKRNLIKETKAENFIAYPPRLSQAASLGTNSTGGKAIYKAIFEDN